MGPVVRHHVVRRVGGVEAGPGRADRGRGNLRAIEQARTFVRMVMLSGTGDRPLRIHDREVSQDVSQNLLKPVPNSIFCSAWAYKYKYKA